MLGEPTITPGVDCALRLYVESPAGFHLLGKFDSHHDAQRARKAAEAALVLLDDTLSRKGVG